MISLQRCNLRYHQLYWYGNINSITYSYNTAINSSTNYVPFDLFLCIPPKDLSVSGDNEEFRRSSWKVKEAWVLRISFTVYKYRVKLNRALVSYKDNLDKHIRRGNSDTKRGDYVWLDVQYEKG